MNRITRKTVSAILAAGLVLAVFSFGLSGIVLADASATVESTNPWGDGGQSVLNLSGCSGYGEIEVVVEFSGTVSSASGWGFDSYTISGSQVTAVVSAAGSNAWAFDGNVGIQVTGSNITSATLVSVTGSGTASTATAPSQTNGGD